MATGRPRPKAHYTHTGHAAKRSAVAATKTANEDVLTAALALKGIDVDDGSFTHVVAKALSAKLQARTKGKVEVVTTWTEN